MTTYAFQARPVIDPDAPAGSSLVKGATFQFYAYSDTSYATPLTVTARIAGVPTAVSTLTSTDEGLIDEFSVEDQWRVWAKSGTHAVLVESVQGLAEAADAAKVAAVAAQVAAEAAAAEAGAAVLPTNEAIDARITGKADLDPESGTVVASQLPPISAADATTTSKGSIQLAGDLGGTATVPLVIGKASDGAVVHNTGAENVAGVKTFTSAPIVPDGSFALGKLAQSGATSGQAPVWNGSAWAPGTVATGSVASTSITDSTPTGRSVLTGTAGTARTALGLGDSATLNVGTAAGTVKAGNWTPALADLPSATPQDVWQAAGGTWPSRPAVTSGARVNWIGYPGLTDMPSGFSTGLDSYTMRTA